MQVLVARAGLTLNPGQMADLVLAWRQVVALLGIIPRDRPLLDDQAFVFRLPPPGGALQPLATSVTPPAARPVAQAVAKPKAAPATKQKAKAPAKRAAKPAAKPTPNRHAKKAAAPPTRPSAARAGKKAPPHSAARSRR